jgi:aminopeptidase N
MFASVAAFEWKFQVRSPVFWVGVLLFFLLAFGATTVDTIQIGSRGNVNVNSPYALLQTVGIMGIFAIFVVVAMVAGPVLRDDETGFAPILRSTRLGKGAYLGGRFAGALAAALLVLAAVPAAVAIGAQMPWLDAEKVGPFRPYDLVYAVFLYALPTLLVTGAGFFALATATRSMMWTYVGAVALLVLFTVSRIWLRDVQHDTLSALSDPFGVAALQIVTKYWTASDRNTLLPPMTGLLLANRLLWTGIAALLFAVAWRGFRFETRSRAGAASKAEPAEVSSAASAVPLPGALPAPRFGAATSRAQLLALARFDMAFVFRSPAFFVLLFIGVINGFGSSWYVGEWYGSHSVPVTRLMVQAMQGAFTFMPMLVAVYYGGELVWRDRERRVHEIIDATAAPDWAHVLPKMAAIALVLTATALVAMLTGMAVQLLKGWTQLEPLNYLLWWVVPTVVFALQLAVLSVFVQVLVPQKFIGWGVMLVWIVGAVAMAGAGLEHNLYNYAGTSPVPLSDMNGMARFWVGAGWFQLYWSACALLLAVLSHALWRRGAATALKARLAALPRRLAGTPGWIAAGAFAAWAGTGAWIYWNTNVLNRYVPQPKADEMLAAAERELLPFERLPQPTITAVTLDVQLHPREARAVTRGSYRIENRTAAPLEQVHVAWPERLKLDAFAIPGAVLEKDYVRYPYRIYRLQPALQPGEVREATFTTTLEERGFTNGQPLTRLVANGSFVDNGEITPSFGIGRDALLKDRAKRRKHGLPADLRPPTLEDESGRARTDFRPDSGWVTADITVATDADQTPIAPGTTVSDTVTGGRRTVRFRTDAPINHFFSIQSARYEVRREKVGDIDLAVYHHPGHDHNVERMLQAMKASLALFGEQFSPYQFKQARILEFPSYADFAQSFANTIPYSENLGFLMSPPEGDDKIDVVTYVTAHEIAHQWWGHQLVPSEQQGGTMLVESFAQYSALLVMERMYGKEQMRRFLKYELDRYLRRRGGEVVEELPLARVENQPYIHYQKGSLVMYLAKDLIGEEQVNRAMARLLKAHAFKAAPYPNTLDFLKLLREEAGPAHDTLITDLFERITLWDAKATGAKSVQRPDGRWETTFEVEARKLHADGRGKETEAPLDEPFDVGAFAVEPGRKGTATKPARVGVDPYNKRIDRNSEDNLTKVE